MLTVIGGGGAPVRKGCKFAGCEFKELMLVTGFFG